jgi:hypothetical protein
MKTKSFRLLLLLFLVGCTKANEFSVNTGQEIYFQVESIDFAWVYYHSGIMIDLSGFVRGYNSPQNWNWPDSLGYIASNKMKENIEQLDTIFTKINRDTLGKYINKIYKASKGPLTKPVTQSYDAGITRFTAYLYDSDSKIYREVLIKQIGDQVIDNKSAEANQIYNWMVRSK